MTQFFFQNDVVFFNVILNLYQNIMYSYKDIFSNKNKALFVTAHPDDVDVFFGGTIAKLTKDKKEVFVLVVTNGARGSRETIISEEKLGKTRKSEQINALNHLGLSLKNFQTLGYLDGEVENDMKLIGEISAVIRKFKPDIVCTHEPNGYYFKRIKKHKSRSFGNHRDHRMVGRSTIDAVYPFSRDFSFFKDQITKQVGAHIVTEMMFTFDHDFNTKIDITEEEEQKRDALLSHKSQFDKEKVNEIMEMFVEEERYFEYGKYIKLAW